MVTQFPLYSRAEDAPIAAASVAVEASADMGNNILPLRIDDSAKILLPTAKSQIHGRIKLLVDISQLKIEGDFQDDKVPLDWYIAPEGAIEK